VQLVGEDGAIMTPSDYNPFLSPAAYQCELDIVRGGGMFAVKVLSGYPGAFGM
jgi:hypothetical protein